MSDTQPIGDRGQEEGLYPTSAEILEEKGLRLSKLGELFLHRIYPDGTRLPPENRDLHPLIRSRLDFTSQAQLTNRLEENDHRVASIIASGNMPDWWVSSMVPTATISQGIEAILTYIAEHKDVIPHTPRFIDTPEQIASASAAIRSHVLRVIESLEYQGAKHITLSVCSASAGFDMMLVALLRDFIENGKKNISVIITPPFSMESVAAYSIPVGLAADWYSNVFAWLCDQDVRLNEQGHALFTTPTRIPYFVGDEEKPVPTVDEMHALGTLINANPNGVYSDVNMDIVRLARSLGSEDTMHTLVFDQGVYSRDLLGGARHLLALSQQIGIPMGGSDGRVYVVQDGIVGASPYTPQIYDGLAMQYQMFLERINLYEEQLRIARLELGYQRD